MKKITALLCALAGTIMLPLYAQSLINVHDNSLADWNNLPENYVFETVCPAGADLPALRSAKIYADSRYINILVEPDMKYMTDEWVPFHVYLDTDNSDETGGFGDEFLDANADIVLETAVFAYSQPYSYNPAVFKWWGPVGGYGWEWADNSIDHYPEDNWGAIVGEGQMPVGASQFVDGKIEIQIDRYFIPAVWNGTTFGIGMDILQNWNSIGLLPQNPAVADNGAPYHGTLGKAAKMKVFIDGQPVTIQAIDGVIYQLDENQNTAEVRGFVSPGQRLTIPASCTFDGTTYNVRSVSEGAFSGCWALRSLFCNCENPPLITGDNLYGLDNSVRIYVPDETVDTYRQHPVWGQYNILPMGSAQSTETTVMTVAAGENTVQVIWPAVDGAVSYELVIIDKNGNLVCTLIFNAFGQLTSIVFHAPARDQAPQQTQSAGFAFTVSGLESGQSYNLTITSKDGEGETLQTQTMSFTTTDKQGITSVENDQPTCRKFLRNGQIFILRGNKEYSIMGVEMR